MACGKAGARQPKTVLRFYDERRRQLLSAEVRPNAAHLALVELERRWPGEVLIVTQNIDDLHERAGSTNLVHMHGELLKARCASCETVHDWRDDLTVAHACPQCAKQGTLRPHVVWFGEMPLELHRFYAALEGCSRFLAIGTSGQVYPAAGFVQEVRRYSRARTVELNLEPSAVSAMFDEHHHGPAGEIVPAYVERLLGA